MTDDELSMLLTALMLAVIRVTDALVALQRGVPVESIRPRDLNALNEEARELASRILSQCDGGGK